MHERFYKFNPHVEEMIRFQYWFNEKMFPIVNKTLGLREQVDKKLDISCSLFSRNIQLSYASYMSCFNGITTAAYNLLRTVYESILAQYYVGLYDNDDLEQYILEMNPTYKKKKTYTHNFFKQALYEGDVYANASKFYRHISGFAHANPATLIDTEYDKKHIEDCFLTIASLSFLNVSSHAQIYHYKPEYLEEIIDEMQSFFDEKLMQLEYKILPLFPNKKNVIKNVFDPRIHKIKSYIQRGGYAHATKTI